MSEYITFRNATMDDGVMLHRWRNDEATRAASHSTSEVGLASHLQWLSSALANPSRTLFIVEINGVPVGTVRADEDSGVTELSWTVAPEARGMGVAKKMVREAMLLVSGNIKAEVKNSNSASIAVAIS